MVFSRAVPVKMGLKETVLHNLESNNVLYGYDREFAELLDLVLQTVTTGGSNSVLLLGPRGVGKTHLVHRVLSKAKDESRVFATDGLIVNLDGLLETDDKLALRQIARQLHLESVQDGLLVSKRSLSFADNLDFLLKSLKSGDKQSKPIIFVLDNFHLFCAHHNQTLLYNLFDVCQSKATPMLVVGLTSELDVLECLEKRVRSRFNHRQINMFPEDNFEQYYKLALCLLTCQSEEWNSHVKQLFEQSADCKQLFRKRLFYINSTVGYLKHVLSIAVITMEEDEWLTFSHLQKVIEEEVGSSQPVIANGLTVIETCVLVAIKHLQTMYDGQPFNFEMAYHEFDKFVSNRGKMYRQERDVAMKAWETLADLKIIEPVDRGTKVQKEYRLHLLQVLPDSILKSMDGMPQNIQEWASATACA